MRKKECGGRLTPTALLFSFRYNIWGHGEGATREGHRSILRKPWPVGVQALQKARASAIIALLLGA